MCLGEEERKPKNIYSVGDGVSESSPEIIVVSCIYMCVLCMFFVVFFSKG